MAHQYIGDKSIAKPVLLKGRHSNGTLIDIDVDDNGAIAVQSSLLQSVSVSNLSVATTEMYAASANPPYLALSFIIKAN